MYIHHLAFRNFVCFKGASTRLFSPENPPGPQTPIPNVNLLLADNGGGKTSLLRAVALTALSPIIDQSGFVPHNLVRFGDRYPIVLAELIGDFCLDDQESSTGQLRRNLLPCILRRYSNSERFQPLTLSLDLFMQSEIDWPFIDETQDQSPFRLPEGLLSNLLDDSFPGFFVLGYGATRRVDASEIFDPQALRKQRLLRYQRVAGLFEDYIALTPLHGWFPRVEGPRRDHIIDLINRLLPHDARFTGERQDHEYTLTIDGGAVPVSSLSDGYRGFMGLVSDMLYHMHSAWTHGELTARSGIVMIDEIDLHLHPSWQRTVVPTLAACFPRIQFILTSHSPIVAGTLHSENILVLEMQPGDAQSSWPSCQIKRLGETVHGMSADQILTSGYFGLDTTRAQASVDQRQDLARRALEGDKDAALDFIKSLTPKTRAS